MLRSIKFVQCFLPQNGVSISVLLFGPTLYSMYDCVTLTFVLQPPPPQVYTFSIVDTFVFIPVSLICSPPHPIILNVNILLTLCYPMVERKHVKV